MNTSIGPSCPRHAAPVPMRLQSLHTDAGRPGQLIELHECPECGNQVRVPAGLGSSEEPVEEEVA